MPIVSMDKAVVEKLQYVTKHLITGDQSPVIARGYEIESIVQKIVEGRIETRINPPFSYVGVLHSPIPLRNYDKAYTADGFTLFIEARLGSKMDTRPLMPREEVSYTVTLTEMEEYEKLAAKELRRLGKPTKSRTKRTGVKGGGILAFSVEELTRRENRTKHITGVIVDSSDDAKLKTCYVVSALAQFELGLSRPDRVWSDFIENVEKKYGVEIGKPCVGIKNPEAYEPPAIGRPSMTHHHTHPELKSKSLAFKYEILVPENIIPGITAVYSAGMAVRKAIKGESEKLFQEYCR